jgi:hypothetical protein
MRILLGLLIICSGCPKAQTSSAPPVAEAAVLEKESGQQLPDGLADRMKLCLEHAENNRFLELLQQCAHPTQLQGITDKGISLEVIAEGLANEKGAQLLQALRDAHTSKAIIGPDTVRFPEVQPREMLWSILDGVWYMNN